MALRRFEGGIRVRIESVCVQSDYLAERSNESSELRSRVGQFYCDPEFVGHQRDSDHEHPHDGNDDES